MKEIMRSPVIAWRREGVLDVYMLAGGLFLLASPWLFGFVYRNGRIDAEVVGFMIVALSLAALVSFAEWEEWLKLALGAWLIAAPWMLGFAHTSAMHVSIVVGIIVAYLAGLEIWISRDPEAFK